MKILNYFILPNLPEFMPTIAIDNEGYIKTLVGLGTP